MLPRIRFNITTYVMILLALLGIAAGVLAEPWESQNGQWHGDNQSIMGTEVTVSLWLPDTQKANKAIADVMAIMRGVDQRLSPYIPTSELSQLNAKAALADVPVSNEMALLITHSQMVYALSAGAFDITFASVGKYYQYREKHLPTKTQIEELLPALNTKLLKFNSKQQTLKFLSPKVAIDLGGIAKGYAVDLAIEHLISLGVEHAYVSAGGDSRVLGDRLGRPWLIGIKNPRLSLINQKATVITLPLSDSAISTSGDYERYFIDEATGERIHHIINPKTGTSATGVMSVTILGEKGLGTDPLSTAVFVLGVKKGLELINSLPEYDAVIIDSTGQVHYSNGLMPPA